MNDQTNLPHYFRPDSDDLLAFKMLCPNWNFNLGPRGNNLVEVKSKQHLLEEVIKTLKAEVSTVKLPSEEETQMTPVAKKQTASNKSPLTRTFRKNKFSISLQMAKSKSMNTHSHSKRPPNKTRPNCNLHTSSANTQSSKKGLKSPLGENQQTEDKLQIKHKLKVILGKGPPMNAKPKAKEESYDDFFNKHIDFYKGLTKHQYLLATGNPAPSGGDGLQAPNPGLLGHISSSSPESIDQTILQAEVYNTDSGNQNTQDCDLDTPTEIASQNNHNTNGSFLAPPHRKFNQYDITLF
ncbi:hypothetical protein J6590_054682 [Homalodisca vitripennis]|nr:hypothetical protein J6590_054682 [Homalodisca vitripennis]